MPYNNRDVRLLPMFLAYFFAISPFDLNGGRCQRGNRGIPLCCVLKNFDAVALEYVWKNFADSKRMSIFASHFGKLRLQVTVQTP